MIRSTHPIALCMMLFAIVMPALTSCAATTDLGKQGAAASVPPTDEIAASRYSAADEALYMARFKRLSEGGSGGAGLAGYDILEPIQGAQTLSSFEEASPAQLSPEALAKATQYVAARNTAAFIVWKDGAIETERYFGDNTRETPLVSRSLSKPVTALIVGRALAQGHIQSLDQPVADFITEWADDPRRSKILVRHLLDMRTGFLPQGFAMDPKDVLNRAYLHPRHDEVIIHDYPMTHEPGTRYEYSNATSEMVAPVIERATGMRYSEYLSQALLEPIGAAGGSIWTNREGGMAHSGCCMLLPARAWLKMGILVLQDGVWDGEQLLPEGFAAQMRQGTAENQYYGLGLWLAGQYVERRGFAHPSVPFGAVLHSEPYLDKDIALFDGNGNQTVYMIPSKNMVVVRLGGRPAKEVEWDNPFLPNLLIRDLAENGGEPLPEVQPL
jgi:CubicO group peptidase (beta-lactamase class C family)